MLTAQEQAYLDFALGSLPGWVRPTDEFLAGAAKMFGSVDAMIAYYFSQALISQANGATGTTPDWLGQHARDRGTARQGGEDDPTLRDRLRNVPDALTRSALLSAANATLAAAGIAGSAALVELPRDGAYWGHYTAATGTGGVFGAPVATVQEFTPDVRFPAPPLDCTAEGWGWLLTITGAAIGGNNVADKAITSLSGNGAKYANAGGSASADPTCTWTATKQRWGTVKIDGHARFYWGRGYRYAKMRPLMLIMILPFGTTAGVTASVLEMLRQKKAAGILAIVETRAVP